MTKKHKRHHNRNPDPQRVLAGDDVGAHDLIDLIHRVNPTGRELSPAESEERYRKKRSLQSQLIARFHEQLEVRVDPARSNVVTLLYQGRDACHTLLSELDPDARAWAQGYLDRQSLEATDGAARSPAAGALHKPPRRSATRVRPELPDPTAYTLEQLLNLGQQAADRYDFEVARQLLRAAAETHPHSPAAASAYARLLVDTLGDNQTALALGHGLSKTLARDPEIRELLSLAAAREGLAELVESYLKRLRGGRAGEAYRALCELAISSRDPRQAQHLLDQARERDPLSEYELQALSDRIAVLRQELRKPLEERFERLFAAGDLEQAEQQAEDCLIRWPDGQAARTMLTRIEQTRSEEQAESCLREAWAALDRQEFPQALTRFQEALALGSPQEALGAGYLIARRQVEEQRTQAELKRLAGLLRQPDPGEGLLAYLQTDQALREMLRDRLRLPMLDWLEALGSPHSGARQRTMVQAVLALAQAIQALERGAVQQAASLVSPHRQHLRGLDQANKVWAEIQAAQTEARRQTALGALFAARQALEQGQTDDAARQLKNLNRQALTEPEREEIDRLLLRLRRLEQCQLLEQRVASLLEQGQLLQGRDLLDELIESCPPHERTALLERRIRLSLRINRQWLRRMKLAPDPEHVLLQLEIGSGLDQAGQWLASERDEMLAAFPVKPGLFVCRVGLAPPRCIDYRVVITPEPWEEPIDILVEGWHAQLSDVQGRLLNLSLDPWDILSYRRLIDYLPADQRFERLLVHPGDRFCWLEGSTDLASSSLRIIDLAQARQHRILPQRTTFPTLIAGSPGEVLLREETTGAVSALTTGGKRLRDYPALAFHIVHEAARLADGSLVTLSYEPYEEETPLVVSVQDRFGEPRCQFEIPQSAGELLCSLAAVRDPPLVLVLYRNPLEETHLLCLRVLPDAFEQSYCLELGPNYALLQDSRASKAAILIGPPDRPPRFEVLSEKPPRIEAGRSANPNEMVPEFGPLLFCGPGHAETPLDATLPAAVRSAPDAELLDWARAEIPMLGEVSDAQIRLLAGLLDAGRHEILQALLDEAPEERHSGLVLDYASVLYARENWEELQRLLGPLCPSAPGDHPPPQHAKHFHHLLGIALWHSGRLDDALAVWRKGEDLPGTCALERYIDLASYFVSSPEGASDPAERPLIHDLMSWLQKADSLLHAHDYNGAIRTLDRPLVWLGRETQSFARLSFALLRCEETGAEYDFLRLTAFSRLLKAETGSWARFPRELRFPGAWSRSRIEAHRREAEAWLARVVERGRA